MTDYARRAYTDDRARRLTDKSYINFPAVSPALKNMQIDPPFFFFTCQRNGSHRTPAFRRNSLSLCAWGPLGESDIRSNTIRPTIDRTSLAMSTNRPTVAIPREPSVSEAIGRVTAQNARHFMVRCTVDFSMTVVIIQENWLGFVQNCGKSLACLVRVLDSFKLFAIDHPAYSHLRPPLVQCRISSPIHSPFQRAVLYLIWPHCALASIVF